VEIRKDSGALFRQRGKQIAEGVEFDTTSVLEPVVSLVEPEKVVDLKVENVEPVETTAKCTQLPTTPERLACKTRLLFVKYFNVRELPEPSIVRPRVGLVLFAGSYTPFEKIVLY
jgi:hypothetical protein